MRAIWQALVCGLLLFGADAQARRPRPDVLVIKAARSVKSEDYAQARRYLAMVDRNHRKFDEEHFLRVRASLKFGQGQFDEAVNDFEAALALAKGDPKADLSGHYLSLGLARYALKDYAGALEAFEGAASHGMATPQLAIVRTDCLHRLERVDEALAVIEAAAGTWPGDRHVLYHRALVSLAKSSAPELVDAYFALPDADVEQGLALVRALDQRGATDQAKAYAQQLVTRFPDSKAARSWTPGAP
ncbi:MAG: tetratricopeptide repeat protein [Myxococcota bacterium]